MRYLFKSNNLIGDGLYISGALRSWIKTNIRDYDEVYLQTLPDHIAPLYEGMIRDLFHGTPHCQGQFTFNTVFNRPDLSFEFEYVFDVNKAFQLSDQKKIHISECYAEMLGVELEGEGNAKYKPIYIPEYNKDLEDHNFEILDLHDCILLSMYSMSCSSRGNPPGPPNKMLPWEKWKPMIELLRKEYPTTIIRTVGAPSDKPSAEFEVYLHEHYIEPMHGIPLNRLAVIMKNAKLLVTIDNGMSHLAASQELSTFLMYPRALMPHYILPLGNPKLDYVHIDPVQVSASRLKSALEYKIKKVKEGR